jgi:hypothetical protein
VYSGQQLQPIVPLINHADHLGILAGCGANAAAAAIFN